MRCGRNLSGIWTERMSEMNELDLFAAFTDVDDRFVLEAMELEERAPKRLVILRAAVAAAAILLIAVAGFVTGGLLKK